MDDRIDRFMRDLGIGDDMETVLLAAIERIAALEAERGALKDILREVWDQFSIPASDGRRWSGGLSVLDDVQQAIGGEG